MQKDFQRTQGIEITEFLIVIHTLIERVSATLGLTVHWRVHVTIRSRIRRAHDRRQLPSLSRYGKRTPRTTLVT
jgi:hypothetical protein